MSTFTLTPRGPFSLARSADVVAHFPPLRHQPKPDISIRLGFILDREHVPVAVDLREEDGAIHGRVLGTNHIELVERQVARILSLDHDGTGFPAIADSKLAPIMRRFEGLRPVCFTSPYECASWAILSQRITTTHAAKIVAELVAKHGDIVGGIGVFPRPERLLAIDALGGVPPIKVERLHAVARAALDGALDADRLRALGDVDAPQELRRLPGIGPFWSAGIYLRACGIADVFPDEPLSIAALGTLHGAGTSPSPTTVARLTERYRPFRMWVAFLLRLAAARAERYFGSSDAAGAGAGAGGGAAEGGGAAAAASGGFVRIDHAGL
jgi:DNA-3-methyladenine glycosylase II